MSRGYHLTGLSSNHNHSSLVRTKPAVAKHQAEVPAAQLFNLHITDLSFFKELDAYVDRNFYMRGYLPGLPGCREFVLKILNDVETRNE